MLFAGLNNVFKTHLQVQLEACLGFAILTPSWQLDVKMTAKNILRPENEFTRS
jgi:hypothetical protein